MALVKAWSELRPRAIDGMVQNRTKPRRKSVFRSLKTFTATAALIVLAACGNPTKADLVKKAEGADTKTALEAALGRPDDLSKMGPLEKWTYKAKDGDVVFVITGDSVALQTAN